MAPKAQNKFHSISLAFSFSVLVFIFSGHKIRIMFAVIIMHGNGGRMISI
jgi:hypothetical protein